MRFLLLLLASACFGFLPALDLGQLPSPRPTGWLVDASGSLDAEAQRRCSAACAGVAATGRGQLVVVVVPDCGGLAPREAGLHLFNRWCLGDGQRNDGVLLLVALAERRSEFLLGSGIDDDANVLRSQAIVDRDMLPLFRSGRISVAVAIGAEVAARELFGGGPAPTTAGIDVEARIARPAAASPQATATRAMPLATVPTANQPFSFGDGNVPLAVVSGGIAAVVAAVGGTLYWLRRRPRICPTCRIPMLRLDEVTDDAYLTAPERVEESIHSIDYDVWACPTCPHVAIFRYRAWFTCYHACPACGARTASDRTSVVSAATEQSTGLERIDTKCVNCGHHESHQRSTPRLQRSSSGFCSVGRGSAGGGFHSMSSGGGGSSGRGGGGGW